MMYLLRSRSLSRIVELYALRGNTLPLRVMNNHEYSPHFTKRAIPVSSFIPGDSSQARPQ